MWSHLLRWLSQLDRWPSLAIASAVMTSFLLWRPISDTDIFWQLKLGEITIDQGIPQKEPFLSTQPDRTHVPVAWLTQVIYAKGRILLGWIGLQTVDTLLWIAGYILLAASCRREHGHAWAAIVALFLAHMCAFAHASLRPQTSSILAFCLLLLLVRSGWKLPWVWSLGAILLVTWQNAHPSAVAAGLWLGTYACAEWGLWLIGRGGEKRWLVSGLTAIAGLALIATPAGTAIFPLSAYNTEASKWFRIGEWMPIWDEGLSNSLSEGDWYRFADWLFNTGRISAFIALGVTIPGLLFRWRRLNFSEVVASLPLMLLMIIMHRFILFWSAAMIPIWYRMLIPPVVQPAGGSDAQSPEKRRWSWNCLVVAMIWALAIALPLLVRPWNWTPDHHHDAAKALRDSGFQGIVYTNYFAGGTVIDYCYPAVRITHDGRYYLYPLTEWKAHELAREGEVPVAELEEKFHPGAFFLRPQTDLGLIRRLGRTPGWRLIYDGDDAVVFLKGK